MKTVKTVDVTPTWEGLLPALLHLWSKDYQLAKDELLRMAIAADRWNKYGAPLLAAGLLDIEESDD